MSVMGFFEPAASPTQGAGVVRSGLGGGITLEGPVLEGRMSVDEPLAIVGTVTPWNQAEIDAIWAGRDSVFG